MRIRCLYLPFPLSALTLQENEKSPQVEALQQQLTKLELYTGSCDGSYNEETAAAITAFQEQHRLLPSGQFTPATVCCMYPSQTEEITPLTRPRNDLSLPRANILISKGSRQLTLFNGNSPLRHYPVGIGKPATPTPVGNFAIAVKVMNPGGMLGSRWLGLSLDSYGIHGTSMPWLIGQMVSHGCIRMKNPHVEELFALVRVGTPVYIRD